MVEVRVVGTEPVAVAATGGVGMEEVGLGSLGEVFVGVGGGIVVAVFAGGDGVGVELADVEVVGGRESPAHDEVAEFVVEDVDAAAGSGGAAEEVVFVDGDDGVIGAVGDTADVVEEVACSGFVEAAEFGKIEDALAAGGDDDVGTIGGEEGFEVVAGEEAFDGGFGGLDGAGGDAGVGDDGDAGGFGDLGVFGGEPTRLSWAGHARDALADVAGGCGDGRGRRGRGGGGCGAGGGAARRADRLEDGDGGAGEREDGDGGEGSEDERRSHSNRFGLSGAAVNGARSDLFRALPWCQGSIW